MEKVTIATVEVAPKKDGGNYWKVTLGDGRKCNAFNDDFTSYVGKQVDVDVTTKGTFNNIYLPKKDAAQASAPAAGGYTNKYPPKAPVITDLDYRKEAVRFGLMNMELIAPEYRDRKHIAATIKWYENYLRTGEFDLPKDQSQA